MKKYLLIATALVALASCSDDTFVGENSPNTNGNYGGAITFNSGAKAITRSDAHTELNNQFIVGGFKGNGTSTMTEVFDNYIVNWTTNTAYSTESNTANWEYVGINAEAPSAVATHENKGQTIKYWDYAAAQYDFAAYSVKNSTRITSGDVTSGNILVTEIDKVMDGSTYKGLSYTLKGAKDDLANCYISDMVTAYYEGATLAPVQPIYQDKVTLNFRSLAAKIRVGIYETIPGYSVKNVFFYQDPSTTAINANISANTSATLLGTDAFKAGGKYTVTFPTIGSGNINSADYNKAHVAYSAETYAENDLLQLGALTYGAKERNERTGGNIYLNRSSAVPSWANSGNYTTVLPNETGSGLELRVNYTLEPIDGAEETITVHGATAFIPAAYAQWKPNYAYTYIFKISDNTNGWTSTVSNDPKGLYPITFDAVVADTQDGNETITTVSTPSITTYQKGSNVTTNNEYSTGKDIYLVVDNEGSVQTLTVGTIGVTNSTANAWLYEATVETGAVQDITEMSVDNAIANGVYDATNKKYTVHDANGKDLVVTTKDVATLTSIEQILATDSPTGVAITVNGAKFTPVAPASGTKYYVFQYQVTAPTFDSGTKLDADTSLKGYYTESSGTYTRCDDNATADGSSTYYKVNNTPVYQYKVIKVKP